MSNTPNYIRQMNWKSGDEASLLEWQIKTQAHEVKGLEYYCITLLCIGILALLGSIVTYFFPIKAGNASLVLAIVGIVFTGFHAMALFGEVRRKVWLIYRLVDSGIECYYWRAYPKSLFKTIRGLFMWGGGLLIIIGLITNLGFMVLAGPVSIVIGLVSVATTKEYEEAMVNFSWNSFIWSDVKSADYDEKRQVIHIAYDHTLTEKDRAEIIAQGYNPDTTILSGSMYLFTKPELVNQALNIVEQHLPPNVPLNRNKVKLPATV